MKKPSKASQLDPAAICRSSDPMAVRELLTKVGDKWTIFVVLSLDLLGGRARFSALERAVPGISQRMLSSTLKNLEREGLVIRELFPEVPPRVEYEMTDFGKSLRGHVRSPSSRVEPQVVSRLGRFKAAISSAFLFEDLVNESRPR